MWLWFHIQVFAHPRICTPVGTLTSGGKISPELVSLPVLRQFSTILSKTSSGAAISTAGPSECTFIDVFFPTVLNQKRPPVAGSFRTIFCNAAPWHVIQKQIRVRLNIESSFFSYFVCSCGNQVFVSILYFYSHLMNINENYVPPLVDKLSTSKTI